MVLYGQIVIGPPGAGKTTYCKAMADFLKQLGRKTTIVNIDPANEDDQSDIDISNLIQLEDVMDNLKLGPNGGLIYCMEFLDKNFDWLAEKLGQVKDSYLLIDCPGQVELYTHNDAVKNVIKKLERFGTRLCAVQLVDSHYCNDPGKYIAVCLTTLNTMLQMELPQVNVLSKVDLVEKYGKLNFNIDYYTDVLDLQYLVDSIAEDPFTKKYKKLNEAMTGLIENYSLVNFVPLSVKSKERMLYLKNCVDKANGYCFGSEEERNMRTMMSAAMGVNDFEYAKTFEIREKFMEGEGGSTKEEREPIGNDLDKVDIGPEFQV